MVIPLSNFKKLLLGFVMTAALVIGSSVTDNEQKVEAATTEVQAYKDPGGIGP